MGVMEIINLFDLTVETSLLILLIGTINKLLRKRLDPNIRYFLWIFVAIRLLVPIRVTLPLEIPEQWNAVVESVQVTRIDDEAAQHPALYPPAEFPAQHTEVIAHPNLTLRSDREITVHIQTTHTHKKVI